MRSYKALLNQRQIIREILINNQVRCYNNTPKSQVKNQFTTSYKKVKTGLTSQLDSYVRKHMDVIDSYNKKHKKTISQRINIDFKKGVTWNDVIKNPIFRTATLRYLNNELDNGNMNTKISLRAKDNKKYDNLINDIQMTDFQKRFYTLMSAYASTVAKGPHGSGKSIALLTSALNLRRSNSRGTGINSLVLVKSNEMVFQYQNIVESIINQIDNKSMDNRKVAQFLFRGSPNEEMKQEDDLADVPCPHMLVTTPQRLLDLLSSRGMDYIKINSLAFIGVDDFDSMLHSEFLLETKKKAPVVMLLDYVLKLQDYKRNHNEPHPQIVLIVNDSTPEDLVEQIKRCTEWIDWNKFATVGKFNEISDIPTFKYIPFDVTVSTILASPVERPQNSDTEIAKTLKLELAKAEEAFKSTDIKKNAKKKLERLIPMLKSCIDMETLYDLELNDMNPFQYSDDQYALVDLLFRSYNANDHIYSKHRNQRRNHMNKNMKVGEMELLVNAFEKALNTGTCSDWCKQKRVLLVHEDEISSTTLLKYLALKIPKQDLASFNLQKDWNKFKEPRKEGEPWIYITNTSNLKGLTIPGLDTIFVLGIDTLKDVNGLSSIATRMRPSNGLIPADKYTIFSRTTPPSMNTKNIRGRLFIIASHPDFGDLERNFLERSFVLNGLVRQNAAVNEFESWSEQDQQRYESITGIGSSNGRNATITFGGIKKGLNSAADESNVTIVR